MRKEGVIVKNDRTAQFDLPHWRQEGVTYFVTFRTVDSLPQEKLKQWQLEKERWLHEHPEPYDGKAKREFYKKFPERLQHWLDQGYGECVLKDQDCKKILILTDSVGCDIIIPEMP